MDCFTILAQATGNASPGAAGEGVVPIARLWEQIGSLEMLEATTFISFGVVCLFYGWRVFKILVVINFGLLGLVTGMSIVDKINGLNNQLMGGLVGMGVLAVLSVPLMRWAVSILGAAAGGILTSGIWYAVGLPERYMWAGGLIGVVAGGMISFIIFKVAVILFSSMWGSGLIVTGFLAVMQNYPRTAPVVQRLVFDVKWFLPVMLMIPMFIGVILQHRFLKSSKDWDMG
ncbi:MAG: hypothetical protein ACYTFQ_21965 [Planctomycetota bacterium]|jgi:hypothetical protein